jgi:hypothetical protein
VDVEGTESLHPKYSNVTNFIVNVIKLHDVCFLLLQRITLRDCIRVTEIYRISRTHVKILAVITVT